MKKLLFTCFLALTLLAGKAQKAAPVSKPFRVDISLLSPLAKGNKLSTGIGMGFSVEPKYAVKNNLQLGIRIEGAFIGQSSERIANKWYITNAEGAGSVLATSDFIFSNK